VTAGRASRAVALVGILAMAVAVAVAAASGSERRQLASNLVFENEFPVIVPAGARACQAEPSVPGGTGALRLLIGTYGRPGPPLAVSVTRAGRTVTEGRLRGGWREGHQLVAVRPVRGDQLDARLCLRNRGRVKIALGGRISDAAVAARVGGAVQPGQFRVEYDTARPESWWAFAGHLPARVATVRGAFPHGATFAVWILLLVGVAGAVVLVIVRGDEPDA
jgi:hypothetical protein